ncbi:hypothetical protein C8R45DRAFT_769925, partial [Mycena sanguinolenta]
RNHEALQVLNKGITIGCQEYWMDRSEVFQLQLYFLFAELAAVTEHQDKALKAAQQAVTLCRTDVDDGYEEQRKCTLIHALTTLSNCLDRVGRNEDALTAAQEAVLIYTQNASCMWEHFLYTIRRQELGANAFHALSIQLATLGDISQALQSSEKATELYHELVMLAPRHLPALASSLCNQAALFWVLGYHNKAITTCEEAVNI